MTETTSTTWDDELAFSDIIPIVDARPKPRNVGLTEVRSPAYSIAQLASFVDTMEPHLDSVKWTVGTQRLLPRERVLEINDYLHRNNIEVSSGGLLESVMPLGEKAVVGYLEQSKALGFDIIEISSAFVGISVEDKCKIVKRVLELGMKPKPEVNAFTPGDHGYTSASKVIRESEAVIEAGAWKVMIEESGIFSEGNDGLDPKDWDRDLAWQLASRVPQEYLYWEASDILISNWLINSFGPDVNLFGGHETLGFLASFRAGAFYMNPAAFGRA